MNKKNFIKPLFLISALFLLLTTSCENLLSDTSIEDVAAAKEALTILFSNNDTFDSVTSDLILPTKGNKDVEISWASDDQAISVTGKVTRPSSGSKDVVVMLTATLIKKKISNSRSFKLTVIALPDTTAPAEVSNLSAKAGNTQAELSWTIPTDSDFAGVKISAPGIEEKTITKDKASETITGLTNGTEYTFTVKTYDTTGNISTGATVKATPQTAPDTTTPAEVSNLTGVAGNAQAVLSWTNPADTDLAGVKISAEGIEEKTVTKDKTSETITGLTNGTEYTFTVKTYDTAGNVSTGTTIKVTPGTAPSSPVGLSAGLATPSSLTIRWDAASGAAGYKLYRASEISGSYTQVGSNITNSTSFKDTGLSAETTYWYTVSAYNDYGDSDQTSAVSGTTFSPTTPSTPAGLSIGLITPESITVNWTAAAGAEGYRLYRFNTSSGTYTQIGTDISSGTSYTDTGLSAETTYWYKVSAYNNHGETSQSPEVDATTKAGEPPSIPTVLSVGNATTSSLTISWTAVEDAAGYRLYRASNSYGAFTQIGGNITNDTTYTDTGLSAGTTYWYTVSAYNKYDESSQSSPVSGTTGAPPSIPTVLSVGNATSSSLTISWSSVTGAAYYKVYRASSSSGSYTQVGGNITNGTSYTDTGLSADTTYWYKVSAYNTYGESDQSGYAGGTTSAAGTPPSAPAEVSVGNATTSSLTVSWTAVESAAGYKVYRWDTGEQNFINIAETNTETSYTDTGLSAGVTYVYAVSAHNNHGESYKSGGSGTTIAVSLPPPPQAEVSVGNATTSSLTISWTAVEGAAGYRLYRASSSSGPITQIASDITTNRSYTDTGLSAGTTYWYKVIAYNTYEDFSESSAVSGTTNAAGTPPATPGELSVGSASTSSLTISWASVTGAEGYKIYRASSSSGPFTQIGSAITSDTSHTDTGLSADTTYWYKVRAYNTYGESYQSLAVSGTTATEGSPPSTPAGLSVGSASTSSLTISWSAVTGAEGYKIYRASSSSGSFTQIGSDITSGTSHTDTGLSADTTYWYKVSAYNTYGESDQSSAVSGTTATEGSTDPSTTPWIKKLSTYTPAGLFSYQVFTYSDSQIRIDSYDSSDNLTGYSITTGTSTSQTQIQYDVNDAITGSTVSTFNSSGNTTEYVLKDSDGNTFLTLNYEYDSHNNILKVTTTQESYTSITDYSNEYDTEGNLTKVTSIKDGAYLTRSTYTYSENVTTINNEQYSSGTWVSSGKSITTYNSSGYVLQQKILDTSDEMTYRIEYEYE